LYKGRRVDFVKKGTLADEEMSKKALKFFFFLKFVKSLIVPLPVQLES
jgi:hypothetical protein